MNFLKRALCAIRYYKRNTILLFLIFSILFTMILSGLCIRQASIDMARKTGIEVGGTVIIDGKTDEDAGKMHLTLESGERIASHPAVQEARLYSDIPAHTRGGLRPMEGVFDDSPVTPYDITLMGSNSVHPVLQTDCHIMQGKRPKEGEKGYAVIHQYMAEHNSLELGSTIKVAKEEEGGDEIELTVTGIYYRINGYHFGSPEEYEENAIFVDLETVAALEGTTDLDGGEFVMYDPAEIPSFLSDIEAMALPDRENFGMIALDGEYRKIALSMDSIVMVSTLVFWAAIALGMILLTALVMISLSSREFEIGVLLSMGEGRGKVIVQLAIENLVPVLLGVTAGAILSSGTAVYAADFLGASARGIEVQIEAWAVGIVYLCGVGLMLLASCVTAYKVFRFQPKKLMMTIE